MRTQVPHWRKLALPAGFALACVVLTLLALRTFGGSLPLQPEGYRFQVRLPNASSLVAGADAKIAGVDVGEVVDVEREGNEAVVSVELKARFAPLGSQARVIPRQKSLLGEGYLEIAPGPASAPPLPERGTLAASQVKRSVALDEFLATFSPDTRERMRRLFAGLSTALGGREEEFNASLGHAAEFSGNLETILAQLDRQRTQLRDLFARSGQVMDALGAREGILQSAIENGERALDVTASRDRELAATIKALPLFLRQLRTTARTIGTASPELNAAVRSLLPLAPQLAPALAETKAAAPELRALFRKLSPTLIAGKRGLPTIPNTTRAAREAFKNLYPASRELIPLVQLMDENSDVFLPLAGAGNALGGVVAGPGGIVLPNALFAFVLTNEVIAGWKKKLPSNRSNPYPNEESLRDIERIGYPRSFDCRHTGNRAYLPPLGGAPPCTVQGPFEFNGETAFYPRLRRAPP